MKRTTRRILKGAAATVFLIALAMLAPQSWLGLNNAKAAQVTSRGGAAAEMLAFALNFRTATNYQVSARNAMRTSQGNNLAPGDVDPSVATDVQNAVKAIAQLPCEAVDSANLSGRTFAPGVYCLSSAELAGSMTLDAGGDPTAVFVFRSAGSVQLAANSNISLVDRAPAGNVFIVSSEAISVGENAVTPANLIAAGDISLGKGSSVRGRVASVDGNVVDNGATLLVPTGYIEVCKELAPGDPIGAGTLFTFNVAGTDYLAPAGGCTAPILVNAGNVTIVEALRADTAVVNIAAEPASRLFTSNLGTRTAVVAVPQGDATDQTIVTFTNQTTKTGTLEICKYGYDDDVTGYFNYTVQGVFPTATSSGIITVPVGFCSGVITTTVPQTPAAPLSANVTELARAAFRLEAVDTLPINKLSAPFVPDQGFDANGVPLTNNTNGGYANLLLNEGGPSTQVLIVFHNRSLPGRVKVCKITADPIGIPVGTLFRFKISGLQPTSPTQTMPGVTASIDFDVPAGPVSQDGFCVFAPGRWVVGTQVTLDELGISANNTKVVGPGELRVSRIRSITGLVSSNLTPSPGVVATAVITARNAISESEFTNYLFRPAILKLCKAGGPGVTGTASFTLSLPDPLTSLPVTTAPITVPVNYCTVLNGPFPAVAAFPNIGTFNLGTQLTITEAQSGTSILTSVTSPTGSPIVQDLTARTGTITLNKSADLSQWNEIKFLNSLPAVAHARFDFDGDGKSDMTIYRNGLWWYAASGSAMGQTAIQFGLASDKLVAADYDGDGRTDAAVFRNGTWYVLGSTDGMSQLSFGSPTDIPQPADFDGDGKADFVVYRPSNGTWYMQLSAGGFRTTQFGLPTDRPVAADFDGDGVADPAVFRDGTWFILGSTAGFYSVQFGMAGDLPVQADYDGDRKADVAVYRDGTWYLLRSTAGFTSVRFGLGTDVPVPADYDGDGKTDTVVYRPSTTVWHILLSGTQNNVSGGYTAAQFGADGDVLLNY